MNFHEYRAANSICCLHGKAPRAGCLKYNEKSGCYFMQYKNNSNVIAQLLQKIRRVRRTAGMLWVWRRFPWSALAMGKGALRWMATSSFFSRRQPCRDSMEFNVCQEAKNHSNSTKSLECIANILIVKNFLLIKKNRMDMYHAGLVCSWTCWEIADRFCVWTCCSQCLFPFYEPKTTQ